MLTIFILQLTMAPWKEESGKIFVWMISAFSLLRRQSQSPGRGKQPLKALSKDKIPYIPVGVHPNSTRFYSNGGEQQQWQNRKEFQLCETHPCFCDSELSGESHPAAKRNREI